MFQINSCVEDANRAPGGDSFSHERCQVNSILTETTSISRVIYNTCNPITVIFDRVKRYAPEQRKSQSVNIYGEHFSRA